MRNEPRIALRRIAVAAASGRIERQHIAFPEIDAILALDADDPAVSFDLDARAAAVASAEEPLG
jgi:hypothetical protein